MWGAWLVAFVSGDFQAAKRLLDELFAIANTNSENSLTLQAHHAARPTLWVTGFFSDALRHIDRGFAFYRPDTHGEQAFQYGGHDPGVCGYATAALIRTAMGYVDHGNQEMEAALQLARELDHIPTVIHSLWCAAELYQVQHEPLKVEKFTDTLLPLLSRHGSAVSLANATMLRGWAKVVRGQKQEGIKEIHDGLAACDQQVQDIRLPFALRGRRRRFCSQVGRKTA